MKYRLTILPQAMDDVRRNAEWWATRHSAEEAVRWLDMIQSQLQSIVDFPESHAFSIENDDFPYEIRDKLLGLSSRRSYRAVFTIKDDTIFVLTVRRAAQDSLRPEHIDPPPTITE